MPLTPLKVIFSPLSGHLKQFLTQLFILITFAPRRILKKALYTFEALDEIYKTIEPFLKECTTV